MSDPRDFQRDPALDAAWRAHSTELPPPRVDAAILAAAHREARSRPSAVGDDEGGEARAPSRAWWGFAAAATIGALAFGLLQLAPQEIVTTRPAIVSDVPAEAARDAATARQEAPKPQSPPTVTDTAPAPKAVERQAARAPSSTAREEAKSEAPPRSAETAPGPKLVERDAPPNAPTPAQDPAKARASNSATPPPPLVAAVPAPPAPSPVPAVPPPPTPEPRRDNFAQAFPAAPSAPRDSAQSLATTPAAPPAASQPTPASPAPAASMAQAPASLAKREAESRERVGGAQGAAGAAAPGASSRSDQATIDGGARTAPAQPRAIREPDAWIARIRTLLAAGERDEAERELRAFRAAYPDADERLPEPLRPWAAGVKR